MPYGEQLSIHPCEVKPDLQPLQKKVAQLIICIRATEKAKKAALEAYKNLWIYQNLVMDDQKKVRQEYLLNTYPLELKSIGVTLPALRARMHNIVDVEKDGIYINLAGSREKMFNILTGDDAFLTLEGEGPRRTVFVKKTGILSESKKHYVKDHYGRYTRRYAYVEKPWNVFEILLDKKELKGKHVPDMGGEARKKTAGALAKYEFHDSLDSPKVMSIREMAFVNQEDGSTVQRGLPLGSSSKPLHGNEGYRFGRFTGVLLKVDLARIPTSEEFLLLNLYCFDAQRSTAENPTLGLKTFNLKFNQHNGIVTRKDEKTRATAAQSKTHTDSSTQKNRELLLLALPLYAVTSVTFHDEEMLLREGERVKELIIKEGGPNDVSVQHEKHCATFPEELFPE